MSRAKTPPENLADETAVDATSLDAVQTPDGDGHHRGRPAKTEKPFAASRPVSFRIRRPADSRTRKPQPKRIASTGGKSATFCIVTRVSRDQRDFFREAGGARWVREVIDECIRVLESRGQEIPPAE